jgi:hypothetical protein
MRKFISHRSRLSGPILPLTTRGLSASLLGFAPWTDRERHNLFDGDVVRTVETITPYLIPGQTTYVKSRAKPLSAVSEMLLGNFAKDGGHLICDYDESQEMDEVAKKFLRPMFGGQEFIKG